VSHVLSLYAVTFGTVSFCSIVRFVEVFMHLTFTAVVDTHDFEIMTRIPRVAFTTAAEGGFTRAIALLDLGAASSK
jgi:hypothetical protein